MIQISFEVLVHLPSTFRTFYYCKKHTLFTLLTTNTRFFLQNLFGQLQYVGIRLVILPASKPATRGVFAAKYT
jgi:hypothetical protein